MKNQSENNESKNPLSAPSKRRDFFATGMRCVIVGGIGSFAAIQELKRRRLIGNPKCIVLDTCTDCIELAAGCQKDQAANFRVEKGIT